MGLFNRRLHLSKDTMVGITEQGKRTAERVLAKGRMFAILSLLNDHSPRTISDISTGTQIEVEEVKRRVKVLAGQGYVRLTSTEVVI